MTDNGKLWLAELRNNPKFRQVMKEFRELRPILPRYTPQASSEANRELVERIKFETGRQDGFDLIYLLLTGERLDG